MAVLQPLNWRGLEICPPCCLCCCYGEGGGGGLTLDPPPLTSGPPPKLNKIKNIKILGIMSCSNVKSLKRNEFLRQNF